MKVNLATTDETLKWNFPRGEADTINGYLKGSDVPNLRILVSYHYYKDEDLRGLFEQYFKETMPEIFMDSGAYSAATQKKASAYVSGRSTSCCATTRPRR